MSDSHAILAPKLRRAVSQLPHLTRALALVWRAAPGWTAVWATLLLLQGLLPVATVYLTRPLVNSFAAAFRTHGEWQSLRPALLFAALMAAVLLLSELLQSLTQYVRTAQADLAQDHITGLIHRQSLAADLAFYESPDFYDHLHRARAEASHRPAALLDSLGSLLQNGLTLLAMGAVLIPFGPWLPLLLLAGTAPALYVVLRSAVRQHEWRLRVTPDERRTWYYDWLLTTADTAAEMRLFDLGPHFVAAWRALRSRIRGERRELARRDAIAELSAATLALAASAAAIAWMGWRAIRGLISLGDLALFYQAFQQGLRLVRSLLSNLAQLYTNSLFLGNLFEFLALKPAVSGPPNPRPAPLELRQGIRFQGLSFRYPGSHRLALDRFDLEIPAGAIAAIVGPNGAGKSTLLKLLCRFYDPDTGSISLDGVDLRDFALDDLRRSITALFQQPVHYNATARENIAFGDLPSAPADAVIPAAEAAGAHEAISHLPDGYDHMLGRWFAGGAELSVGEWQRVALARAFLRRSPILILDEPTSAMDPWAEADWLDRFRRLAAGRTAILITHRFTTARLADSIHVMGEGRIVESGPHDRLIALGGQYAAWWAAQRIG